MNLEQAASSGFNFSRSGWGSSLRVNAENCIIWASGPLEGRDFVLTYEDLKADDWETAAVEDVTAVEESDSIRQLMFSFAANYDSHTPEFSSFLSRFILDFCNFHNL